MKLKSAIGACLGALMLTSAAAAHESFSINGTVAEVTEHSITTNCDDETIRTIALDRGIPIYDGTKLVQPAELGLCKRWRSTVTATAA